MSASPVHTSPPRSPGALPAGPSMSTAGATSSPDATHSRLGVIMSGCIAVINAGSSSVKFALFQASDNADVLFRGQVEGIGLSPHLKVSNGRGEVVAEHTWSAAGFDHDAATREILATGARLLAGTPVVGIGHRIVHGGMKYNAPVRLDATVLADLTAL